MAIPSQAGAAKDAAPAADVGARAKKAAGSTRKAKGEKAKRVGVHAHSRASLPSLGRMTFGRHPASVSACAKRSAPSTPGPSASATTTRSRRRRLRTVSTSISIAPAHDGRPMLESSESLSLRSRHVRSQRTHMGMPLAL